MLVTLAEVGGAQSYVADLVTALARDFDVTVAAHGRGPLARRVRSAGATFVPLRFVRRRLSPLDLLGLVEVWLLCLRVRPDIVHANSSKAGAVGRVAALLAGVRHRVFTTHGWAFAAAEGPEARIYALVERCLRPITSAVICVSERERRRGVDAHACTPARAVVIPNAVDVTRFGPHVGNGVGGPVELVSVGRLAPPKDFPTLIDAVAALPRGSVRLHVLGDGPQREELVERVARHGLEDWVAFEGTRDDVAPDLARADVFVLASRSEGMPMSVLEAMAAGLPVVASDVGGICELVDDETGMTVPPADTTALAEALARLVVDGELRRRLGAAGRSRAARRFALPQWQERHRALYAGFLGPRAAVGAGR